LIIFIHDFVVFSRLCWGNAAEWAKVKRHLFPRPLPREQGRGADKRAESLEVPLAAKSERGI
jgi:hypothetical protein